jgi:hypothetical protein
MKITTFYWKDNPVDMVAFASRPEGIDHTGYSMFGFDALQVLVALDLIPPEQERIGRECLFSTGKLPHPVAKRLLEAFHLRDLINPRESVIIEPIASIDGIYKLEAVVCLHEVESWHAFIESVVAYMRAATEATRGLLEQAAFEADGKQIYPNLPYLAIKGEISRCMVYGSYTDAGMPPSPAISESDSYLSERAIAQELRIPRKDVRDKLVSLGYLNYTVRSYAVSPIGLGYVVQKGRERLWHSSVMKRLILA